jgi:hypothetical protein
MKPIFAVLPLLLLTWSMNANAFSCTGRVMWTSTSPNGAVHASVEGPDVSIPSNFLCNLNAQHDKITPAACKQILNTLRLAQLTKRSVDFGFDYLQPNTPGICKFQAWTDIHNGRDWYYGPSLRD